MLRVITCSNSYKYTYKIDDVVGSGYYSCVYKGLDCQQEQDVAIKVINKVPMKRRRKGSINGSDKEVLILQEITDCENLIKIIDVARDETHVYIITEYCEGGTLKQLMSSSKKGRFEEKDAILFLYEIIKGVRILHKKGIMHRDLNLENTFLKEGRCVIGDFGSATMNEWSDTSWAGTPEYRAPEVFKARERFEYSKQADIWSIGVMFHEMVYGKRPYEGDINQLLNIIEKEPYKAPQGLSISKDTKDLLIKMLVINPRKRIKIEEVFQHQLFSRLRRGENKAQDIKEVKEELNVADETHQVGSNPNKKKIFSKKNFIEIFIVILLCWILVKILI